MKSPDQEARPPRIARFLLRRLLRSGIGEEFEVALEELFRKRLLRQGRSKAGRWYWRQLVGFAIRWRSIKRGPTSNMHSGTVVSVRHGHLSPPGSLAQDVRLSLRRIRREPAFAAAVALTLSLGIGAATAVFGVVSTTLLSKIPYESSDELVIGRTTYRGSPPGTYNGVSGLNYFDYRESSRSFENLAALRDGWTRMTVTGEGDAWVAKVGHVTWNFLPTLRVEPILGRGFLPEEEEQADAQVAVISFGLWQSRFGGSPSVLGRTFMLEGSPHTVVGVLPNSFRFLWDVDIWRISARPHESRDLNWLYLVGRLRSGVSMSQAQLDTDAISSVLEQEYPEYNENASLRLTSLQEYLGGDVRTGLLLPAAATACLLLLACANVAGLLLARGQRRMAEIAMRSALGASRWRLIRYLLTECVTLTLPAGLLGICVGYWLQRVLLHLVPVGRLGVSQPVLDGPVLLFVLGASIATGLLVGIAPAIRGSGVRPSSHLGTGRQLCERKGSVRFRGGLVALQISISTVLLVGSGLLARSLSQLSEVDLGFSTEQVLTAGIRIPATVNREREDGSPFFASVIQEIRALPGVQSAGAINRWPIRSPGGNWRTRAANRQLADGEHGNLAYLRRVSPGYFATMNIPIRRGRDILETDQENTPAVAVISESLAQSLYPNEDPVGRSVALIMAMDRPDLVYEIVGVIGNARLNNPRMSGDPVLYLSALQARLTWMGVAVRTGGDPAGLFESIQQIVRQAEPDAMVSEVGSMEEIVDESLADFRRLALYLGLFAGIALLLASVGLYGSLAYYLTQQEHEIGVRIAMGAPSTGVFGLVVWRGVWILVVGILVGLAGAYPATFLVREFLFQTVPLDLVTYAGAVLVLGLVATVACFVPALRATRVDPAELLRSQ